MISLIVAAVVIICDLASKLAVLEKLKDVGSVSVIKGVLRFTYVENRGAAFGMLSDSRWVFLVGSVLIVALISYIIWKMRNKNRLFDVTLGLILGGGIGNMIDRIRLGYVVDFIDFCAFPFWKWVFNVADAAVVIGCILLAVVIITDNSLFEDGKKDGGNKVE